MTLATYEDRTETALVTYQDAAVHRLADWARSAEAAHHVAETLVRTSFCPDSFRNKPGEATAAILAGMECGLQPMAALRSFDIIQGQAAARAITLRAIVQGHGHEMELVESTATRCRMRGRRRGSAEWQSVVWTIDRARDLGLTNKPNWKNQPQTMLVARATSELARLVASDAILGIAYSAEELADGGAPEQTFDQPDAAPSGTRKMSRPLRPVEDTPEPGDPEDDQPDAAEHDIVTSAQLKKIGTLMSQLGMTVRADALVYVNDVIGREVTSRNDLTKDEASRVIDSLERDADPDDTPPEANFGDAAVGA